MVDPRWLQITPEDETGGRQRRFFGWVLWGAGIVVITVVLLLTQMYWQAAAFAAIALLFSVGAGLLFRWAGRGLD